MLNRLLLALAGLAGLCVSPLCVSPLAGAEPSGWPSWRGPFGNGVAAPGHYPTSWSADKHLAWQAELPGRGASTPVIMDGHVFVTSVNDGANVLQDFTLNGQSSWKIEVGQPRKGKHAKATGSNSSPITDGKYVYAYFKSGDLACVTMDGKVVWRLNLQEKYGEDTLWWDLGTSPVLTQKVIVIAVMQSGPSYLLASIARPASNYGKPNANYRPPKKPIKVTQHRS